MPTTHEIEYVERESGRLDLHLPDDRTEPTPVIVWIYGGAFRHGSKDQAGPARRQLERGTQS
ncbi:carboxylesterase family protein [Halarchaeum salinum]|uniref:BD-FAE-like domain-containing protein n=1 Tax=Halarchaeum salinum TaxID=489912 RepID=A0AAV3S8X7_9EURY